MNIIINSSNLKKGGGLQVAISFIYECRNFNEHRYHIFLSPQMENLVDQSLFSDNFIFYIFNNPSRFIIFDKTIKKLDQEEEKINPDCVFSVFGPTYWKPKSKHVMGFANGLYLYGDLPYMKNLKGLEKLKFILTKFYHRYLLKYNADIYVLQTKDMKDRFSKFINKPVDCMSVISSKYDSVFEKKIKELNLLPSKAKNEFWFITISAYYPSKNLEIINELVKFIKEKNLNIKFVLTFPEEVIKNKFEHSKKYIINLGPVKLEECPYIYSRGDALFLPTLVESFTASYPEAMIMKKPILTSNYSFATTVCKNAALYFNPYDVNDIMQKIILIYSDKEVYNKLVTQGLIEVEKLPSSKDRAEQYLKLCKKVVKNVQK